MKVAVLIWDDRTSVKMAGLSAGMLHTHDEETHTYFQGTNVSVGKSLRCGFSPGASSRCQPALPQCMSLPDGTSAQPVHQLADQVDGVCCWHDLLDLLPAAKTAVAHSHPLHGHLSELLCPINLCSEGCWCGRGSAQQKNFLKGITAATNFTHHQASAILHVSESTQLCVAGAAICQCDRHSCSGACRFEWWTA